MSPFEINVSVRGLWQKDDQFGFQMWTHSISYSCLIWYNVTETRITNFIELPNVSNLHSFCLEILTIVLGVYRFQEQRFDWTTAIYLLSSTFSNPHYLATPIIVHFTQDLSSSDSKSYTFTECIRKSSKKSRIIREPLGKEK